MSSLKKVLYAGSFDPLTKGHLWMIEQGAKMFDEVVVVIAVNPQKQGYFSVAERQDQISESTKHLANVQVIINTSQYVASLAPQIQAQYLLRGIRNNTDFEYERTIERVNQKINPALQTVYLTPPVELAEISSSLVKSLVGFTGWQKLVTPMVPAVVMQGFLKKINYKSLRESWVKVAGDSSVAEKWWQKIINYYSEPHRYYHNSSHIAALLSLIPQVSPNLAEDDETILIYASFFHDLIYNPQSKNNELESSILWEEFSQEMSMENKIFQVVKDTILATAQHFQKPTHNISELFLDLDLSILGTTAEKFQEYEDNIRLEYGFVPENIYQVERIKIMKTLLNPYKTTIAQKLWGQAAENNLRKYQNG